MNRTWTVEQIKYLQDNAATFTDEQMAKNLSTLFGRNFSTAATRKRRQRLKLKKVAHRSYFKLKATDEPLAENQ